MLNEIRAIVILYRGTEPSVTDVQDLKSVIKQFGEANTSASISCLSQTEISTTLVSSINVRNLIGHEEDSSVKPYNKEENAIIYIATKFKDDLEHGTTSERLSGFIAHFSAYVASVSFTGADEEMIKALKIIANKPILNIRSDIRARYRINNKILEAVARVGRMVLNV